MNFGISVDAFDELTHGKNLCILAAIDLSESFYAINLKILVVRRFVFSSLAASFKVNGNLTNLIETTHKMQKTFS